MPPSQPSGLTRRTLRRPATYAGPAAASVPVAFLIAAPPASSSISLPSDVAPTPPVLGRMQRWGALLGAAIGGRYAKRTRR
ncbi:hypothetical protein [Gemmatimonas sp.]|uniref:hypothetical protein n=1 Tax=Gemmatimonas sp. TaxID=1962908 RepID=UPI003982E059